MGVALSGGLDSSTLLARAVAAGTTPHCFTAAFPDDEASAAEVEAAALVARHFGVPHTVVPVESQDVTTALLRPGLWDEPLAEIAVVPLNRVAAAAHSEGISVLLTGEGSDEFFGGYRRFEQFRRLSRLRQIPGPRVQRALAVVAPPRTGRALGSLGSPPRSLERYLWLIANLVPRDASRLLGTSLPDLDLHLASWASSPFPFREVDALQLETKVVLPELYLRKVDLATMAEGVEGRVPLVDVAFLSATFSKTPARGKNLLRSAMAATLPREILTRREQGFGAPMDRWVRTVLRSDVEDILADAGNPIWSVLCRSAAQELWKHPTAWDAGHSGIFFAIYRWGRWGRWGRWATGDTP